MKMIIVHLPSGDLENVQEPQTEISGNEGVDLYNELRDICEEDSEDRRASDPFLANQSQYSKQTQDIPSTQRPFEDRRHLMSLYQQAHYFEPEK